MCGICGVFGETSKQRTVETVRRMAEAMQRRGPDSQAVYPTMHGALGFARLAILDLSVAGNQPMATADGQWVLAFNGEIYNYRALRAELEGRGHRFASSGDTEVVLQALVCWGEAALARLNGMFALAFCHVASGRVMLARDRWGMKPLFLRATPQALVFASQLDLVCAVHGDDPLRASAVGLYEHFTLGFPVAPHGLLDTVDQVAPGHTVTWQPGCEPACAPFISPNWWDDEHHRAPTLEELDALLEASVRRHLVSDVPVGVLLSGGVDSPLVAAVSKRITRNALPAYTIGVDDVALDETGEAVRMAAGIGLDHRVDRLTGQDVLGLFDDVMECSSHPVTDFSLFPTLAVFRLAARDVKVVLTGDGADELFCGYVGRYRAVRDAAPVLAAGWSARAAASVAARFGRRRRPVRDLWEESLQALARRKLSTWRGAAAIRLFPALRPVHAGVHHADRQVIVGTDALAHMRELDLRWHLPGILDKVDRASMYWSVEARVPYLDNEFAAAALRCEASACLDEHGRIGKLPLRRLLARVGVQAPVLKKGFTVPMQRWLLGELRERFLDTTARRASLLGMPVAPGEVARLYRAVEDGDHRPVRALWAMLSIAMWEDRIARLRTEFTAA